MDISTQICYIIMVLSCLAVLLLTLYVLPPSSIEPTLIDVYLYENSIDCSGEHHLYSTLERTKLFGASACVTAKNTTVGRFHFQQICNGKSNIFEQKNQCNSICSVCDSSETFMIVNLDPICLYSQTNDVSYGYETKSSVSIRLPDCLRTSGFLNG